MTTNFFDRAYSTTDQQDVQELYQDWAATYDAELAANGYMTPTRCAAALAQRLADRDAPIYDFACGTGLSGLALAGEGFTTIDGGDISEAMLASAAKRGVYRTLTQAEPGAPPPITAGDYAAISAMGALSPGAAPAAYLDLLLERLSPGALLVFSYNDHTLAEPSFVVARNQALADGRATLLFEERGVHIEKLGSQSIVYVMQRTG